ncbi:hypothetical protein SAMN05444858_13614 [Micromonospora avicenniae]|uniref:Uncharacterized protein n=1 Tax=Micromonospora avicenniae TaxID=1198245 RepID=A0A1N7FGQ5_9ACTN|nr:hypothetical protein SAMN05444858_13614 [Micromonospora avicenniae]
MSIHQTWSASERHRGVNRLRHCYVFGSPLTCDRGVWSSEGVLGE